ncbi:MAG: UDP-2,3-diacylglucosamine diphosphatase [Candidatus Eisenbacteria bacterium]
MSFPLSISRGPIYFISDVHLGAKIGPPEREAWLLDLLSELPGRASALFVLGDLFDFWFEYRHALPKGTFRISRAFADVVDSGVPVVYLGGNHDFWLGSYLREEVGALVSLEPITVELHGRRVHLAHGDGLGPGDGGYKILKSVLRNRLAIAGYRALHPDLGIPFGYRVSSISRKHTTAREVLLPRIVRDIALPRVIGEVDAMVMGHVHEPVHYQWSGRDFLIIGDWIENFTHVRMVEGQFHLMRRSGEGYVRVAPEAPPGPI